MKLANSALGENGDIIPGNRLSEILSSCLLSVREVSSYLDRNGSKLYQFLKKTRFFRSPKAIVCEKINRKLNFQFIKSATEL